MGAIVSELNVRGDFDTEVKNIVDYVADAVIESNEAYETARLCLADTLGCGILALNFPECTKLLGAIVPGATLSHGARVPGMDIELDPVQAAFNIGTMIRWLDYNDTWLAAEWGHPSDNLGGILATADYLSRKYLVHGKVPLSMRDVFTAMIKAHEIQGIAALENAFNRIGLDHVVLVKLATCAVVTHMLGGTKKQICNAVSQVFVDGQSLRTYRHAPNTGTRKSWAAGDATSRAVRLALISMTDEMGYPSSLSAKKWGLYDVCFKGNAFTFPREYQSYVMENILFKVSFPAEFHGQTAVEAALRLHPQVKDRLDDIERVSIRTQESAIRIINKRGELYNAADRDHCLQYMVAIGLIFGELKAQHYQDEVASDLRIDTLRNKIEVFEEEQYTRDYLDPQKRSITNAVQVFFRDGSSTEVVEIEYPLGHRRRREESIPVIQEKFRNNLLTQFAPQRVDAIISAFGNPKTLDDMPVNAFMDLFVLSS